MTRERAIALAGLLIGVLILGACVVQPEAQEAPQEVITEEVEVPMKLSTLAAMIRSGEIDVGDEPGLALDQRFHTIHSTVLGLGCVGCHSAEFTPRETIFFQRDVSPIAPGAVDRRACLGCHRAGLATPLYSSGVR